ncbi:glycoside hydrolase family 3 C-terminal domain-containing protein [Asticcacaulis sp. 201]|uniref:glycoside hydrolase family 3 C-terminal domain-containing protein n=1 Tax=Asticcacaulis sp. 201 TaxID=3028787 RepID=UPI0029168F2C|nr:glycoside hydrolase family 3 C-terminal domain-containing protein [Asticcacaulis sp. 201]MDV6330998.1 glycoside hydrolase family 3 C-terminal domain-containing protein [Asticcacaulis sp. 201]
MSNILRSCASGLVLAGCLAISATSTATCAQTQAAPLESSIRQEATEKATALVAQLTLDEKVAQLLNVAPAIPRLNIPAYNWWTESLHGAIGAVPTTNFPEPIGLAATFDSPLIKDVASVISVEVRGLHTLGRKTGQLGHIGTGLDTWSPNINIFRDPRWGRGQETYGEDPYLTAQMGVSFVQGMQGSDPEMPDVIATPKHFAVHSGPESTRHVANVFVSPHDMEDTYLPAFRAAIVDGHAGSIMCAYNRIDGQPACGNDFLMKDRLRTAWGFKGYVVSDCDAVVDIANHHKYAADPAAAVAVALKTGVDNECNGATLSDTPGLGERYKEAYARGLISMADIDTALVRLFSARYRNGDLAGLAGRSLSATPVSAIGTPEHQALALKAAIESLVLLKNDGVLPLRPDVKIALVGPLADATRVLRGNYSSSQSAPPISVEAGLRAAMPKAAITLVPFGASMTDGDPVPNTVFLTPAGKPGLKAEYYNAAPRAAGSEATSEPQFEARPLATRTDSNLASRASEVPGLSEQNKVVWTGYFVAPETGTYRLGLTGVKGDIELDDGVRLEAKTYSRWAEPLKLTTVTLQKGKRYPLHLQTQAGVSAPSGLVWKRISAKPEADLGEGIKNADVVVAVVGLTSDLEGEEMPVKIEGFEGGDKTSLDIPADQRKMLEQVKASGKRLVVVLMNGSPLDLSWAKENASAIVEAWYPGQAGGRAVGDVLAGAADPGGRLPLTFYSSVSDLPPFDDYSMKGRTYRYFNGKPVYGFGYGLSYTQFAYETLQIQPVGGKAEDGVTVTVKVKNVGPRTGNEVAQLYLTPPAFEGVPRLALRGFQRLSLKAGESRTLTFTLSPRDLSFVDRDGHRSVMPGRYQVSVGSGQPEAGIAYQAGDLVIASARSIPE